MPDTAIHSFYADAKDLMSHLEGSKQISFRSFAEENLRKSLLLAAASYFERRICEKLLEFARGASNECEAIVQFIKNKAIARQYHTFFDWENRKNANSFFGLFGIGFREDMSAVIRADHDLEEGVRSFLELGGERNRLVHEDFVSFPLEKTVEEIYDLFVKATVFVERLAEMLEEYAEKGRPGVQSQ